MEDETAGRKHRPEQQQQQQQQQQRVTNENAENITARSSQHQRTFLALCPEPQSGSDGGFPRQLQRQQNSNQETTTMMQLLIDLNENVKAWREDVRDDFHRLEQTTQNVQQDVALLQQERSRSAGSVAQIPEQQQQQQQQERLQANSGGTSSSSSSSVVNDDGNTIRALEQENKVLRQQILKMKQAIIGYPPIVLDEGVPKKLKKDDEFVAVAVDLWLQGQQVEWQHIPTRLQSDSDVVLEVFKNDIGLRPNWEDVPVPLWSNPAVVLAALECRALDWEFVPDYMKQSDNRIALFGVRKQSADPDAFACLLDREFMEMEIFDRLDFSWEWLPTALRTDIEFARNLKIRCTEHGEQIFARFPPLRPEPEMWKKLFSAVDDQPIDEVADDDFYGLIGRFAPPAIRSDRDLMLEACSVNFEVYELVAANLSTNHDFLLEFVDRNLALFMIPHPIQRDFPDVVDLAVRKHAEDSFDSDTSDFAMIDVAPDLWEDRDFVLRWFDHGLPFLDEWDENDEWKRDEGIFIRIAQHCIAEQRQASFEKASVSLRGNNKFMLRVLKVEPSLCGSVAPALRNDFDLCLVAFSGAQSVVQNEISRRRQQNDNFDYMWVFRSQVVELLTMHSIFMTTVLPAISQQTNSGCALTMLDQGKETSLRHKKNLARYLGVPTGRDLRQLRQALRNLNVVLGMYRQPGF